MRKTMKKLRNKKGITLIALVVTIVIILILAGITVGMVTSDNGILKETKSAKEQAEIDNEKNIVERAKMLTMMRDKSGKITLAVFEPALKDEAGTNPTEVNDVGDVIEVLFTDTDRYYEVDKDGNVSEPQKVIKDQYAGDITKGGRCDGSEKKPYEINCIEDLVVLSNMTNGTGIKLENGKAVEIISPDSFLTKYITLTRNLNFKSKYSYADSTRTDFGNINGDDTDGNSLITEMTSGTGFQPIGRFTGNFNGDNNSLDRILIVTEEEKKEAALFSYCDTATIKNLRISGNISGKWHSAGICGSLSGKIIIENCINKANVTGYNVAGGIIAYTNTVAEDSYIINCVNYGNIKSTGRYYNHAGAGGICGCAQINIIGCKNHGEINGNSSLGGISGRARGTVKNCENNGVIDSKEFNEYSGGIVGAQYYDQLTIYNCINRGVVRGKGCKGGILGCEVGGSWKEKISAYIYNCCNVGKIGNKESAYSGGILGSLGGICNIMELTINNCYTIGTLDGNQKAGIVATYSQDPRITGKSTSIQNSYYVDDIGIIEGIEYTDTAIHKDESEIKSQTFVNLLNSNIGTNADWKKWKLGTNGYPTFAD